MSVVKIILERVGEGELYKMGTCFQGKGTVWATVGGPRTSKPQLFTRRDGIEAAKKLRADLRVRVPILCDGRKVA